MKMKRMIKSLALVAVAAITLAACNMTEPAPQTAISFTATLAPKSGEATRALDIDGHKTWAYGEKVLLWEDIWSDPGIDVPDEYEPVQFIGTITDVDAGGRATVTGTLPKLPAYSYSFSITYPYYDTMNLDPVNFFESQDGDFNTIAQKYDWAYGTATLVADGLSATINGDVSMENAVCITSYSFVDESANDITADISEMAIMGENSAAGYNSYLITPSSSALAAGKLYVAMEPNTGPTAEYTFRIKTTDGSIYTTPVKRAFLEAGKLYGTATFTMHKLAVGDLLYSNGGFYSSPQPELGEPVGIVAYLDDPDTTTDDKFTGETLGLVFEWSGSSSLKWMEVNAETNPAKVEFGDEYLFDPDTAPASAYLTPSSGSERLFNIQVYGMSHENAYRWKYPAFSYALDDPEYGFIPTVQQSYIMFKSLFGYSGEAAKTLNLGAASTNVSELLGPHITFWTSTEASVEDAVVVDLAYDSLSGQYTLAFDKQGKYNTTPVYLATYINWPQSGLGLL